MVLVLHEIEIIEVTALVKVRLVDEVPTRLKAIRTLDLVSKATTLCERMVFLSMSQFRLRFLQNFKLIQSFL